MDIFVEIITLIKITLMANFMVLFLEKSYNYKSKEAILFGLIYAYSSYVICYSFHIMWLDCLYMLPIVLLFVDKYLQNNKIWPYIISLSYTILTNYYIGYMVAIFSGIYFLAKCYITKNDFKKIFKFVVGIIISFGIGMVVILPSILQLKGKMSANAEFIKIEPDKIKLFINVLFNNYVYIFAQKSCFMFSSTLIIVLVPLYYLNKNISKKEKYCFTVITLFLLLPIISPFLNKLWHVFTIPNCFNYRYSFTLIFILILIGARELQNKSGTLKKHFLVTLFVFIILTTIEVIFKNNGYLYSDNYGVSINSIILSCIIYLIIFVLTYIVFYKDKKIVYILLTLVIITDLLIGAKSGQNNNDKYFKREVVTKYDNLMLYLKNKIQNPETERIVFEPDEYGSNMSLKYGYSNIGFFTSARNRKTLKSMYRLGYNVQMDEQLWITSYSGTFLNYSMAGVKYYIAKNPVDIYGFELDEKYDDYYIYINKNNFKIGYYLEQNIEESYNPFKMQNEIINGLVKSNSVNNYFEKIEQSKCIKCNKNIQKIGDEYYIKYELKALKDCSIYLASDYDVQIYINNNALFKNYSNIWSTETGIKQIKNLKKDDKLEFEVKTKNDLDLIYIYVSDNEDIQYVLNNISKNNFFNGKINKNGLEGKVSFKNGGYLVFSIAYDDNWDIYVDGSKTDKVAIGGSFLGTKLKKGEYNIVIKYHFL